VRRTDISIKWALYICLSLTSLSAYSLEDSVAPLYQQHCALCHGEQRLGGMGPALLPQLMSRLKKDQALAVISNGRAATQMPAFAKELSMKQREALVEYIYQEPAQPPVWGESEIRASQLLPHPFGTLPDKAVFTADMQNLFVVVELADHSATILDGDKFESIFRFQTRRALHGGPKYSPDGRYVYFTSRDGWISKFDIYNLKVVAEIRAGINSRNLAVSSDGNYILVGNYLPNTLVLLDSKNLDLVRVFAVADRAGKASRVSAVYNAPPRKSFIAALKDVEEVWEIPYAHDALVMPLHAGWVHDYRKDSGEGKALDPKSFPIRKIQAKGYLDDFFFDFDYQHLIGTSRDNPNGQVINLDAGKKIAEIQLAGMPHLSSAISWQYQGKEVMVTPNYKHSELSVIDMESWQKIKSIETKGPGFFTRSHENSRYAWVDVFFGPHKDLVHVVDKKTLEIVKTLQPSPGKTSAHVEFTRDGKYALLSIWDDEGALVVYDAESLQEVKRIPMKKPSGKYNVYNKTTYARGTSH
jgi:DNA-binding beta-propeller fold protein YncE